MSGIVEESQPPGFWAKQVERDRRVAHAKNEHLWNHPVLDVPFGERLTVGELRRALKSKEVRLVQVSIRLIFGEEDVLIEVPKKQVLRALPAQDRNDWTTEAMIHRDAPGTIIFE